MARGGGLLAFLIAAVLSVSSAAAAPICSRDTEALEQSGVGTIYSTGSELSSTVSIFYEACFERDGWTIRTPKLTVTSAEEATLEAATATLETTGATGELSDLAGNEKNLRFSNVKLNLTPAFKLEGFGSAPYRALAKSGVLADGRLSLEEVVLDRLSGSQPVERYGADQVSLLNGKGTLQGVRFLTTSFALNASSGTTEGSGFTAFGVTGSFGRNAAGSEVNFTAQNALRLEGGKLVFGSATLSLWGLKFVLGNVTYDPACPLELPLTISPFGGGSLGFEGVRLGCSSEGTARGTLVGKNLFTAAPSFAIFINANQGPLALYFGQRFGETFQTQFTYQPEIGFTASFALDTGANLEQTVKTDRFLELRGGLAQAFTLLGVRVRPTLEVGVAGQSQYASAPDLLLPFARSGVSAAGGFSIGPVGFSASGNSSFAVYSSGDTAANAALSFGARLNLSGFTFGTGIRYQQQFVPAPILRHNVSGFTRLDADFRFSPAIAAPALGFSGVRLEQPYLGASIEYDFRTASFVHQIGFFGASLALYNGEVLTDNFGAQYQTSVFGIAPSVRYDLITKEGDFGATVSFYGAGLIYDVGAFLTLPGPGVRFSFGVRLR